MAVKNTEGYDAKPSKALYNGGESIQRVIARMEVAIADDDGQTYILARGVQLDWTVAGIVLPKANSAITAGTDYDIGLGLIGSDGEVTVVEADVFVDGYDFSSGNTSSIDILESPTDVTIGESLATPKTSESAAGEYCIYATANTAGSSATDIEMNIEFAVAH